MEKPEDYTKYMQEIDTKIKRGEISEDTASVLLMAHPFKVIKERAFTHLVTVNNLNYYAVEPHDLNFLIYVLEALIKRLKEITEGH